MLHPVQIEQKGFAWRYFAVPLVVSDSYATVTNWPDHMAKLGVGSIPEGINEASTLLISVVEAGQRDSEDKFDSA